MKSKEQDERLVAAAEAQARAARQQTDLLAARERRLSLEEHRAGYPPLRRLFGSERGAVALLRSIPGFAGLWEKAIPDSYVRETPDRDGDRWSVVSCVCGEHVALRPGMIGDCACERFFFSTGKTVRVKRFEPDAAAA